MSIEPRRRPLTDQFRDAMFEFEKASERLGRLVADDRFTVNRRAIFDLVHGRYVSANLVLQTVTTELFALDEKVAS